MFDFLFRPKHKRECDHLDATNLIDRFGHNAYAEARRRAKDVDLSARNRRHWSRVGRIVASIQGKSKEISKLVSSE